MQQRSAGGKVVLGQLGNNTERSSPTPVSVEGLSGGVTAISAGESHSCAIHNGAAKCWGVGKSLGTTREK